MHIRTIVPAFVLGIACMATTGDASAAKKEAPAQQEAEAELTIQKTGLASMDQFFGQVQGLVDRLQAAQKQLHQGSTNLNTALGLTMDGPLQSALTSLKDRGEGKLSVAMEGNKPRLKAADAVPANVQQGIDAVNDMVDADLAAVEACEHVATESEPLAEKAPGMVMKVPADAKGAGLKVTEIPAVTKKVKHNVDVTTALPDQARKTLAAAKESIDLVTAVFGN
ncbi:MAG: hypothetical protein JXB39_16255 [Deltaproteobacteria bacterium]|nr:hypothetical protein [Deltaproteobacteria bacterium]